MSKITSTYRAHTLNVCPLVSNTIFDPVIYSEPVYLPAKVSGSLRNPVYEFDPSAYSEPFSSWWVDSPTLPLPGRISISSFLILVHDIDIIDIMPKPRIIVSHIFSCNYCSSCNFCIEKWRPCFRFRSRETFLLYPVLRTCSHEGTPIFGPD